MKRKSACKFLGSAVLPAACREQSRCDGHYGSPPRGGQHAKHNSLLDKYLRFQRSGSWGARNRLATTAEHGAVAPIFRFAAPQHWWFQGIANWHLPIPGWSVRSTFAAKRMEKRVAKDAFAGGFAMRLIRASVGWRRSGRLGLSVVGRSGRGADWRRHRVPHRDRRGRTGLLSAALLLSSLLRVSVSVPVLCPGTLLRGPGSRVRRAAGDATILLSARNAAAVLLPAFDAAAGPNHAPGAGAQTFAPPPPTPEPVLTPPPISSTTPPAQRSGSNF